MIVTRNMDVEVAPLLETESVPMTEEVVLDAAKKSKRAAAVHATGATIRPKPRKWKAKSTRRK